MNSGSDAFRVAVLTPSTGNCRIEYALSLARLVGYFSMTRIREECAEQSLIADGLTGSSIGANYELLILKHLKSEVGWTHFLFAEDDMGFHHDVLHILAERRLAIVGCNYPTNKGWPIRFTSMGLDSKRIITRKASTGIEEAAWILQGVTLVERRVFESIPRPWFMTIFRDGRHILQDQYFCEQARAAGYKCFVDHDASKRVWHVGPHSYTWDELDETGDAENPDRPACTDAGDIVTA